MTLPCIRAARRFDARAHQPFWIGGERVGWIRQTDAPLLARWPHVFGKDGVRIVLAPRFDDMAARSAALGEVIEALAAEGHIPGWRNETYAIRNAFDAPPLACIERAASRFFGTMTWAVHLNGIVDTVESAPRTARAVTRSVACGTVRSPANGAARGTASDVTRSSADGAARSTADGVARSTANDVARGTADDAARSPADGAARSSPADGVVRSPAARNARLWIARRSDTKATDPGMLDNVVAGGIGWGWGVMDALVKECAEEAGMGEALALRAQPGRVVHLLQSLPEGTQAEQVFVYDLVLPEDFTPRNQDGEVGEHRLARIDEVAGWIAAGAMTVDASLATLDCLLRRRWIDASACEGIDALFAPPLLP